jgi:hypothetical protein
MSSATIKLFLLHGDARRLRTAELSNWSGKALAAPRTEIDELLSRDEASKSGVYLLLGSDPDSGGPLAYIGEAEDISARVPQHKAKDFWVSVIVFVSKDENLTKAHTRFLEGRLIDEARKAGRYALTNGQSSGARLPESDQHEMEAFLDRLTQLLPVLGTDILVPRAASARPVVKSELLTFKAKEAHATGRQIETGFVVLAGSTALTSERESAERNAKFLIKMRSRLRDEGVLASQGDLLVFARDYEFGSPSTAAAVVAGGNTNGLIAWKFADGTTIKDREGAV